MDPTRYCHNHGLFANDYFAKVLGDEAYPRKRHLNDTERRLDKLLQYWRIHRASFMHRPVVPEGRQPSQYVGLPEGYEPFDTPESEIENKWIAHLVSDCFGQAYHQNRTMDMTGDVKRQGQRPDLIVFSDQRVLNDTVTIFCTEKGSFSDGAKFCREALMIIDAKKFSKGVGADEGVDATKPKQLRSEGGARADIQQVAGYLKGYSKEWGVLTNGRCWRLMCRSREADDTHLRFDLILLLEDLDAARITPEQAAVAFRLFWYLFGPPAVAGGYLDDLLRESEAATRKVRETLEENVQEALRLIAEGFRTNPYNRSALPEFPDQSRLDHLREVSLVLLYRLLFILKAEALSLLPMVTEDGQATDYCNRLSIPAIFKKLVAIPETDRQRFDDGYLLIQRLFKAVSEGDHVLGIPAYNGGLFDDLRHPDLASLRMVDGALYRVLKKLVFLGDAAAQPVPYQDLDVRDLGDIYEGLLEKRLVGVWDAVPPTTRLRGQKAEKKASGSYFTPDRLVEHLVSSTLTPLLKACDGDASRILALRIVDPAMGSGHFLVKAVNVMADWLTVHCDPVEPDAPADNGPGEMAYWKAKVVENCIYGVDYNPMAVELAKVALWLHTARQDKPLSFLDHHLKCGNSLVGATVRRLAEPGLIVATRKGEAVWKARVFQDSSIDKALEVTGKGKRKGRKKESGGQLLLPFDLDTTMLSGIVASIRGILDRPSNSPEDVKAKGKDYADAVYRKLAAHRLLADLWCAQWFIAEAASEADVKTYQVDEGLYHKVKQICGRVNDEERASAVWHLGGMPEQAPTPATDPFLNRLKEARRAGYGPRPLNFFHWELEFPEVAFDAQGKPKRGFGFDVVLGNPPWDKIKPAKRDFYTPFNPELANAQGPSLNALITRMEEAQPELVREWEAYESGIKSLVTFLADTGFYPHQKAKVDGKTTGGDPDLFRYFTERATHCIGQGGRIGYVVPCTLWQAEGCTGLRRLLLDKMSLESLYTFENYRKWAFAIDSRFKFCAVVARAEPPAPDHAFPAAFMLRDTLVLDGRLAERGVKLDRAMVEALSPDTLALLDFRCDADARLMARLHREHPRLGDKEKSGWDVTYRCELHMTNDAWLFKTREWMASRGFAQVLPVRQDNGKWTQQITEHACPISPERRATLPPGGEYWVAATAEFYRDCGYQPRTVELSGVPTTCFIHRDDLAEVSKPRSRFEEKHFRIIPEGIYTALYDGRLLHSYDHAYQSYLRGDGPKQIWESLRISAKFLSPRVFVSLDDDTCGAGGVRIGFRDIARGTDARTFIAAVVPLTCGAGNTIPVLHLKGIRELPLLALLNSFVADSVVRLRAGAHVNWLQAAALRLPRNMEISDTTRRMLTEWTIRLSCTTPELADYWNEVFPDNPWTYASAERDPWKRAELRAEIDAIVAELYGLSVAEYARILTGFPLLDRDQPPLPGDCFATECDETRAKKLSPPDQGKTWDENDGGGWELKPRSFITRDFALLTYIRRRMAAGDPEAYVPQDLEAWYRDVVGIDSSGPLSRFRIGEVKYLAERVNQARALGAVPYIATGSASEDDVEDTEAPRESEE